MKRMKMNKETIKSKLRELQENEEYELIKETVTALPNSLIDDDILNVLCSAYFNLDEYKKAIALLEGQRERLGDDFRWNFRMGLALYKASSDEECEDNDELKKKILERAQVSFARAMNMNPPDDILEAADMYMEKIDEALDELYGEPEGDEFAPEMYAAEEVDAIEEHIKEYFGEFPTIFHELVSPDIHCDIYIVPPTKERNYYTLLTVGMGAHIMDIPEELDAEKYGRAELLICLPPDWKVGENAEEWFWPIGLLKGLARLPINCDTWLGWGHTVDNGGSFAENTSLCGSLLIYPENVDRSADFCELPSEERVNFFEVIPLYRDEMMFKRDNDAHALLEKMNGVSHVVDINREPVCEGYEQWGVIDAAEDHSDKIREKNLPLDEINGCNHIAVFLRRSIERGLTNQSLYEKFPDVIDAVKNGEPVDLRKFINDCLDGKLLTAHFNYLGNMFVLRYYDYDNNFPDIFYPSDVDDCAERYFGTEKYNSEEFKDEAYLFMPFDDDYYQRLSRYIDRAFAKFYPEFRNFRYSENLPTVKAAEKVLGCECVFPKEPTDIAGELKKALADSDNKDWFPLLLVIDYIPDTVENEADELANVLYNANEPFLQPIVVAKTPRKNFFEQFSEAKPTYLNSDDIKASGERLKKVFGVKPAVLTFSENGSMLMLPENDGAYLLLKGK